MTAHPQKIRRSSWSLAEVVDASCFILGTALVLWLAGLMLSKDLALTWTAGIYLVVFWLLLAYVGLPRLQEVLARIYVPDYYIGRTVTSAGILGDPVNLALDGSADQLHAAMTRAGWTRADDLTLRSGWGIVLSAVLRRSDPSAPVSPLFLFGHQQAFAYEQQVGGDASKRHHVRFWPTPDTWTMPGGKRVDWLAAGTFDRSVGLSLFTLQITHKVDSDIDLERDHIVDTVTTAVDGASVEVLHRYLAAFHARNGGGDIVRTDGDLVVLDLTGVSTTTTASATPLHRSPRLPPAALLVAGVVGIAKALLDAVTLSVYALSSLPTLALWAATLAGHAWARTLLLLGCAATATAQLVHVSSDPGPLSTLDLLHASVPVLVLIAVSSDRARAWVARPRPD